MNSVGRFGDDIFKGTQAFGLGAGIRSYQPTRERDKMLDQGCVQRGYAEVEVPLVRRGIKEGEKLTTAIRVGFRDIKGGCTESRKARRLECSQQQRT